jgi:dTDP-4-amino-4,6-dideoxygalactose transaminase
VSPLQAVRDMPFVDLARHHAAVSEELEAAFRGVLERSAFILGDEVAHFEEEFAAFSEAAHCIGVSSGTSALALALRAAGIGAGDEVIVPALTYIASALAVVHAGAEPVFCDVRDDTGLLDPRSAADAVSDRTAAILPVHLYGQCADMDAVRGLADRHSLFVLEDAAQAHGASWRGRRAGSLGDAAAFSFYPSKNLGALGDGGAVCTGDSALAERLRRLRDVGQRAKGEHVVAGFNARLDGLQASFLSVKLRRLGAENARRRAAAALYRELLPATAIPQHEDERAECVHHLFPVRVRGRDGLRERLGAAGIATGVHYSPAVHRQRPFAGTPAVTDLSISEDWASHELSLPIFAEITPDEVRRVAEAITVELEGD